MTDIEKYYNKALDSFQNGNYEDAKVLFEKAIELGSKDSDLYHNYANLLELRFKAYSAAKENYEKAIELGSKDSDLYHNYANLLEDEFKAYSAAKENYEKAIELGSEEPEEIYLDLGYLEAEAFHNYEMALNYFQKAIEIDNTLSEAYCARGNILEKINQNFEEARKCYETAINNDSKYSPAYYDLAILLKEIYGEHEKARQYFDKYLMLENPKKVKKVEQIVLKRYNQFSNNLTLDLTYPTGHKKQGLPLNKICFIGQSGTGKTSLLELVKRYISDSNENTPNANFENVFLKFKFFKLETKQTLINYPAHSVENINKLNSEELLENKTNKLSNIIDFSKSNPKEHWYPILKQIAEYQVKAIQYSAELGKLASKFKDVNSIQEELAKFNKKMQELRKENNSLIELNHFLQPLLSKFYLQVKTEPDNPDEIKFIPIESISYKKEEEEKNEVQTKFLSTGTKEILSRSVPLFALKPEHSIILIDEPENSLYPNVQKEFVDFLTKETWHKEQNCQFFFATHSPTIASSFEPWEIVELQFNENGKVEQKLYYKGDRHVDNYLFYPKYLDIDSILQRVFDVDDKMYAEREEMLDKFADYNIKLRKLENEKKRDEKEYEKLLNKRNEIGEKLDWRVE